MSGFELGPRAGPPETYGPTTAQHSPLGRRTAGRPHTWPDPKRTLTAELVDGPTQGTLTLKPTGQFTYTPDGSWTGRDFFTYKVGNSIARVELATHLATFKANKVKVPEKSITATLTVQLSGPAAAPVSVAYVVAPQSARGRGIDFTLAGGTVDFAVGEKTRTITVSLVNDGLDEHDETVQVWLTSATGPATVGTNRIATLTVRDDDATPKVSFRTKASEGTEDQSPALEVFLSAVSGRPVTVKYALARGSATAATDFEFTPGVLTFAPGETSQVVPITVLDDAADESDETVKVKLSRAVNAAVGPASSHTYTIRSDDPLRTVAFDAVGVPVGEAAGTVEIVVRLSAPSAFPVSVTYVIDAGSTAGAKDYSIPKGTLTFKAGETEKRIVVRVVDDALMEPAEVVQIRLASPTNAVLGAVDRLTLTIEDDD